MAARKKTAAKKAGANNTPPIAVGTVRDQDPNNPLEPTGELWDALRAARTRKEIEAVRERAQALRYNPKGQLMQKIAERLASGGR